MKNLDIKDLRDGAKKVNVEAKVVEKGDVREVKSRYGNETYRIVDAVVAVGLVITIFLQRQKK